MSKFENQNNEMLFEWLLSRGWQPDEAMHKMEGIKLHVNESGNFVARFKDGSSETFRVEHVPKFVII